MSLSGRGGAVHVVGEERDREKRGERREEGGGRREEGGCRGRVRGWGDPSGYTGGNST